MSTKNAAAESALGDLHTVLATVMSAQLKNADLCTPALMNAVRAFLKDNEITCVADKANAMGSLKDNLERATAGGTTMPAVASRDDEEAALAEVLSMDQYRNVGRG